MNREQRREIREEEIHSKKLPVLYITGRRWHISLEEMLMHSAMWLRWKFEDLEDEEDKRKKGKLLDEIGVLIENFERARRNLELWNKYKKTWSVDLLCEIRSVKFQGVMFFPFPYAKMPESIIYNNMEVGLR